MDNTEKKEILV